MGAKTVTPQEFLPFTENSDESDTSAKYSSLKTTAALTTAGVAGRVALQHVPNVSPIVAVAVATGFYFGVREGAVAGASGYYLSNFLVYGGQGPWTAFQVLGAASAGIIGGLIGKKLKGSPAFMLSVLLGVLSFQAVMNIGSLSFASFTGIGLAYLAASIPFVVTHVASTLGFGLMLYGSRRKIGLYRQK